MPLECVLALTPLVRRPRRNFIRSDRETADQGEGCWLLLRIEQMEKRCSQIQHWRGISDWRARYKSNVCSWQLFSWYQRKWTFIRFELAHRTGLFERERFSLKRNKKNDINKIVHAPYLCCFGVTVEFPSAKLKFYDFIYAKYVSQIKFIMSQQCHISTP